MSYDHLIDSSELDEQNETKITLRQVEKVALMTSGKNKNEKFYLSAHELFRIPNIFALGLH